MTSPEEIREALAYWDQVERTEPRRVSLTWEQLDSLLEAARAYADLLENGWIEHTITRGYTLHMHLPYEAKPGRYLVVPVEGSGE